MDVAIVLGAVNAVILIVVLVVLARKDRGQDSESNEDKVALAVNQQLHQFQQAVNEALKGTRQEVESSKSEVQKNTIALHKQFQDFQKNLVESLAGTRKEVEASKGEVQKSASEMHKHLTSLGKTIEGLKQQNVGAQDLARNLQVLLQAPKLRGSHGEKILEEMLDRLLPKGMWHAQFNIDGREAVDAAITFRDAIFPIDAKFPRDDYERYVESSTDEEKRAAWRGFERALKTQIDSIARKYIKPDKGTSDFALMFIPSEAVYYEAIATTNGLNEPNALADYAHERHVFPVSPNTLYAFIQVILAASHNVQLVEDAKRLREGLKKVEYSFERFYDRFEDVGSGLARAAEAYDTGAGHIGRYRDRLQAVLAMDFEDAEEEEEVVA